MRRKFEQPREIALNNAAVSWIRSHGPSEVIVSILVQPNSKKMEIVGTHADQLKVRVSAPAIEGTANEALLSFLAGVLGVRLRDIELVRGTRGRRKEMLIRGVSLEVALEKLGPKG